MTPTAMFGVSAAIALSMAAAVPAHAGGAPEGCLQGRLFSIENDYLGRGKVNTDRWYTNGIHAAWSFKRAPGCVPEPLQSVRELTRGSLFGRGDLPDGPTVAVSLGHNMYTPQDITRTDQQVFDRPWAGFLYVGAGAFNFEGKNHKAVEVKVGLIGPASLAKPIQRGFHKLIDDDEPRGWGNQLRPRLGVQASYAFTHRWTERTVLPEWAALHTHARATVGNTKTLGAVGLTLIAGERDRIIGAPDEGDHLGLDFNERRPYFKGWLENLTFYAQVQVAGVVHNTFVTGRTFGEQPQVELKRTVVMTTLGASWKINDACRLEYRVKRRSPEFKTPGALPDDRYQRYGELRFVRDFDH